MTQSLRQAIALLQMNSIDVQNFVANELMENPFLQGDEGLEEHDAGQNTPDSEHSATDMDDLVNANAAMGEDTQLDYEWDNMYDTERSAAASSTYHDSSFSWEDNTASSIDLHTYLRDQFALITNDPVLNFLGHYVIDAIDETGYARLDVPQAALKLGVHPDKLDDALAIVQTLEPAGIGARTLGECLTLQLHANKQLTDGARVVLDNLDLLAKRDLKKLTRLAQCEEGAIVTVVEHITQCTPKPGLLYHSGKSESVTPDVVVFDKEGHWQVELNAEAMPKVLLNKTPQEWLKKGASKDNKTYMSERLSRAQWLVKSLEQRARTLLKVSRTIVTEQADFFTYGIESLKPLTLKEVADKIEMHESTVSRVTTNKYMQTPMGVFELKYFFSAAIGTTGGNMDVAAASVKAIIKRLIEGEDKAKPLSDEKLVNLLKAEGVDVARRTVAKYREALGILSSSGRRIR